MTRLQVLAGLATVVLAASCRGTAEGEALGTSGCDNGGTFAAINAERVRSGRAPYHWDDRLAEAADVRVHDVVDDHWFSHRSRAGETRYPAALAQLGLGNYAWAGENLAVETYVGNTMRSWLRSRPHHANILDRDFDSVGISCAWGAELNASDVTGESAAHDGWVTVALFAGGLR